ncbi:MAG: helix-turn-helix transcriptional regulator [Cyanobacteria bacterium J06621_8]
MNEELNWNVWIANNIGELLAKNSLSKSPFNEEHISKTLSCYIQQKAEGNIAAFARQLKIPKNTVWLWSKGKNQPSLEMLLRICHRLDISVWEFLTGEKSALAKDNVASIPLLKLKAKAQSLDQNKMRHYLEQALKRSQEHPISMVQVAQQSPFNRRTLYFYFPEICQAISANYARHRKINHERAIVESCVEVRKAVKQLHGEGKYPSQHKVEKLISRPGLLRYQEVKKAFAKAKQELQ